jgi:hypothetical protein
MFLIRLIPYAINLAVVIYYINKTHKRNMELIERVYKVKNEYIELLDQYRKLKNDYEDLLVKQEAIKQIYEGCREAERRTGMPVDFDGDVHITRR